MRRPFSEAQNSIKCEACVAIIEVTFPLCVLPGVETCRQDRPPVSISLTPKIVSSFIPGGLN